MDKKVSMFMLLILLLVLALLIINPSFTGYFIYNGELTEKVKLGYCPTMQNEALFLSKENKYDLIIFDSASDVLLALKNNEINKALIGRKAKSTEINSNINENILKGGYTLVSNQRGFIDYVELNSLEIYTYLENNTLDLKTKNLSKEEALEKIKDGKIILISWKDWNDDFELVVVMNGNEKVKDFRGVFLYET